MERFADTSPVDRHGAFMYDLIWKARKTDKKYLWTFVLLISILQMIAIPFFVTVLMVTTSKFFVFPFLLPREFSFSGFFPFALMASLFQNFFLYKEDVFREMSQFIAIAGDMKRIIVTKKNPFGKIFPAIGFLISGVCGIFYAYGLWVVYRKKLHKLSVSELDVLGTALSHGKVFWKQTQSIFNELTECYTDMHRADLELMHVSVSYGMGCKWMLQNPKISEEQKSFFKNMIKMVMSDHPDLPEEVTMRFQEALN